MHLDTSFIIHDPYRETKIYKDDSVGDIVCLPEVKAEVIYHYRNIKDNRGKQKLTNEDIQEIVDYIM